MKNRIGLFAFLDAVFSGHDRHFDGEPAGGAAIADDAWPDIPVPADVPRTETTPAPASGTPPPPASPAPSTSASASGAPATPAPAGAPAAAVPEPATAPAGMEEFQRAIAEVTAFNRQLLEQNAALIAQLRGGQPATPAQPAAPEPPPLSPQDIAIRDRLYGVIPELKMLAELVAKKDAILGAADAVPQITADRTAAQKAQDDYWSSYRDQQFSAAWDTVAKDMLGEGKTGKDLDPMLQSMIANAFVRWVTSDAARAARYERQDQQLLGEFAAHYRALAIAPLRRTENVAAITAAETAPPMPRGGPSTTPSSPAPTPPAPAKDEDAMYSSSWRTFQERNRAAS